MAIDKMNYLQSSIEILSQFITEHIDNIIVKNNIPLLDEGKDIAKPILFLEILPGTNQEVGMGKRAANGKRGIWKNIDMFAYWIVSDKIGGTQKLLQLAGLLEHEIPAYQHELKQQGIEKIEITPLRQIPKGNSKFYGGRHMITYRVFMEL